MTTVNLAWLKRGKRRLECLKAVARTEGENVDWVALQAGVSERALRHHVAALKRHGYVYTARFKYLEVWLTDKGRAAVKEFEKTEI